MDVFSEETPRDRIGDLFGERIIPQAAITGHFLLAMEFALQTYLSARWMAVTNGLLLVGWLAIYAYVDWDAIGRDVAD